MEWDNEKYERFKALHQKLIRNRQQVPLEILKTQYAAGYKRMTDELTELADWFARCFFEQFEFPLHPKDTAGNEWMKRQIEAIKAEEANPGGRVERYRKALIEDLKMDEFVNLVWEIYDRMEREAFDPYWQRHNRWVGKPENRWIYNDIFKKFWIQPKEGHAGYWIDSNYQGEDSRFPPHIKEDESQ